MPIREVAAELAPTSEVTGREVKRLETARARGHGGDEPHGAADDRAGRRVLAASRAALVITGSTEEVLEVIVGAGQIGHIVTVKEARPVAAGHLEEMSDGGAEGAGGRLPLSHLGQEGGIGAADLGPRVACLIGE